MILVINTADLEQVFIGLVSNQAWLVKRSFKARYRQAETLLPAIDKLLARQKVKLSAIKAIAVVSGPASFTALRIGVVTANLLAWSLKLPVFSLKATEFNGINELAAAVAKKYMQKKNEKIVKPFYGAQPNITLKK